MRVAPTGTITAPPDNAPRHMPPARTVRRLIAGALAALQLYWFSAGLEFGFTMLAQAGAPWFTYAAALAESVISPLFAAIALALAVLNRNAALCLALLVAAPAVHLLPFAAFVMGIRVYGF